MPTIFIPPNLKVAKHSFALAAQSVSGGVSGTGFEQTVASPSSRWKASLTFCVRTEEEVLAWRGFIASLDGRANDVLVGPRDGIRPRDLSDVPLPSRGLLPWAGGQLWAGGAGWATPPLTTATVGAAPQQATAIKLTPVANRGVRPGHYFGIAGRLYMAIRVVSDADGVSQDVTFRPWLRAATVDGQAAVLDKPVCSMHLAKDEAGSLDVVWKQASFPTIDLVESFAGAALAA